jgi:hypothetical protein
MTALTKFDEVTERFAEVKYMDQSRAEFLRDFIHRRDLCDLLLPARRGSRTRNGP